MNCSIRLTQKLTFYQYFFSHSLISVKFVTLESLARSRHAARSSLQVTGSNVFMFILSSGATQLTQGEHLFAVFTKEIWSYYVAKISNC